MFNEVFHVKLTPLVITPILGVVVVSFGTLARLLILFYLSWLPPSKEGRQTLFVRHLKQINRYISAIKFIIMSGRRDCRWPSTKWYIELIFISRESK